MEPEKLQTQINDSITRLLSKPGVAGVIVLSGDGKVIHSTFDDEQTIIRAGHVKQIICVASEMVNTLDEQDELRLIRLRTKKYELLVCPDKEYFTIAFHNASDK